MANFEITEPRDLDEAFAMLTGDDPGVRAISGGTALMLMMKAQLLKPSRLVSLRHLKGRFVGVEVDHAAGHLRVGAMTTLTQLEQAREAAALFPIIPQTMKTLANVRVRNVASVGGNIAHADPHLDMPSVWTALDASALIVNRAGERMTPVQDLLLGYYETTLASDDLIAEIRVPLRPGWRAAYTKITTRSAHDWPALGIAVALDCDRDAIRDLRIVLSAAVDRPTRLIGAEACLRGAAVSDVRLDEACEAAATEAQIESDSRGSADYKRVLLRVHLHRTLASLIEASPS